MAYFEGRFVMIMSPAAAHCLERGITLLIKERRLDGDHNVPRWLLEIQSELHALADATAAVPDVQPRATDSVAQTPLNGSLTRYETAKRLEVTPQMVSKHVASGRLTAVRRGRSLHIDAQSIDELERSRA